MAEKDETISSLNKATILFVDVQNSHVAEFGHNAKKFFISSARSANEIVKQASPDFVIFDKIIPQEIDEIRGNENLVMVPIVVIADSFEGNKDFESITAVPRLIICNTCAIRLRIFEKRLELLFEKKNTILPARTGMIVKYTILFINNSIGKQITRGHLADKAGVTEDYLTRIFHEEMGMPLWDYLNSFRMFYAIRQLLQTDDSVREIADKAGFPDAAYFSRVFHKQFGIAPGRVRKTGLPSRQ